LRTREKTKKSPPLPPSSQKGKKKLDRSWVHAEPSHWLHEISLSKTVHHHFAPWLIMAREEFWGAPALSVLFSFLTLFVAI
jgi:hypothetical protein